MAGVAAATGLFFAKLSRPTSKVRFSDHLVVHERDGVPTLQFRVANGRNNQLLEARAHVSALIEEVTAEGQHLTRIHRLPLERSFTPMFGMTWTCIDPLDDESPLRGLTAHNADDRFLAIVVLLSGTDDTLAQPIHARRIYQPEELVFGERFVDMVGEEDGLLSLDLRRIDETEPL